VCLVKRLAPKLGYSYTDYCSQHSGKTIDSPQVGTRVGPLSAGMAGIELRGGKLNKIVATKVDEMGVQVKHLPEQIATDNRREPITAESRRGIAIQGNWCKDVDAASADCTKALRTESDNRCCPLGTGLLGDCGTLSQERAHGMSDTNAGIGWASLYGVLATNRPLGTNPGDCGVGRLSNDNFRRVGNASNQATMVDGSGLEVGVANGGLVGGYEVGQLVNGFPTGGPVHPMSMFMPMYDAGLMIQHQAPPGGFGMWMESCRMGAVDEYS
jgi:hypothetical protein